MLMRVKSILKGVFGLVLVLIFLGVALVVVGKLTDQAPAQDVMLATHDAVPDSDNGYLELAHLMSDDAAHKLSSLFDKINTPCDSDDHAADSLSERAIEPYLTVIQAVLKKPRFMSPTLVSDELSNYMVYKDLGKLMIWQSQHYADKSNIDQAIYWLGQGISFSQRIIGDAEPTLISYLIGQSIQFGQLEWLREFIDRHDPSALQLAKLAGSLDSIDSFSTDNFKMLFSGEQKYSEILVREYADPDFSQYLENVKMMPGMLESLSLFGLDDHFSDKLKRALPVLIPGYFNQPQSQINFLKKRNVLLQSQAKNFCSKVELNDLDRRESFAWWEAILPNGLAKQDFNEHLKLIKRYFIDNCHYNFYTQAVRLVVASKRYQSDLGELPTDLAQLVPMYVKAPPLDALTGEPVLYDAQNKWFYSRGSNYRDDGGSLNSLYNRQCARQAQCQNTPTVMIEFSVAKEQDADDFGSYFQ